MEQVVLGGPLFNRFLDRQTDGDQADALSQERLIKSGLVEAVFVAISETVERASGLSIECEDAQAQPSLLARHFAEILMKCEERIGVEGIGATARGPSPQMQVHDMTQRLTTFAFGVGAFEPYDIRLFEVP